MKKIVLLKDHHDGDKVYKEGQEIEVTDEVFDFLMNYYMDLRKPQIEEQAKIADVFKKLEKGKK